MIPFEIHRYLCTYNTGESIQRSVSPSVEQMDVEKKTHSPAMFVPTKTAPRVEATNLDMMLRSERGKQMGGRGGGAPPIRFALNSRQGPVDI